MSKKPKESTKQIGATLEQLNKWYQEGLDYQNSIGITTSIPECVRFYEGDQWAPVTEKTKTFPRPVVNIIEMICNNKKSQVLSSPIKLVYKASESISPQENNKTAIVERFNHFAEYQQSRLKQNDINNRIALDGMIKGSMCVYYYWDKNIPGLDGLIEGDMAVECIDPTNVIFSNPNEKDEQKQEWIMLISRENIEKIKQMADDGVDANLINDDSSDSIYKESESETEKYATVMTRFFRHNGEVYFEKATKEVVFNKARPFTPNPTEIKNMMEGKEVKTEEKSNAYIQTTKATVYPIVFGQWKQRDKSIYGRGEVETIIPNQKAINWTLGLQILMAQNESMSPVVVSPDALRGQKITNVPGQVLTDYSKTGKGINFVNKQGMSQAGVNLVDRIADLTRVAVGSSEVMNGELISAGMSGAAIAQLQAQALKPIEDLQRNFWRFMERVGEVLEQFLRFFYTNRKFQYTNKDDLIIEDTFESSEYKNVKFDVVAEAVAGTVMSDVADINILDGLFAKGAISPKTYIKCYPDNAIANRQKLIEAMESEEQDAIKQLTGQLQQVQAQFAQASELLKQQEATINNAQSIVSENIGLKERLLALQAEYTKKMQEANKILVGIASRTNEFYKDAQAMAGELAKNRGLNVTTPPENTNTYESGNPGSPLI